MLERFAPPPPTRSLAELTAGMPGRGRALAQIAWLLAALLGVGWLEALLGRLSLDAGARALVVYGAVTALVVAAYALVRPLRLARRGRPWVGVVLGLTLAPIAATTALGPMLRASGPPPRIGVELADGRAGDGRAGAAVGRVQPGSPAEGRLVSGDLVVAVNDEPLASDGPASDLVERAQRAERLPAGDARFTVLRGGVERTVVLPLPPPASAAGLRGALWATLIRDVALLLLLAALVLADGQRLDHLGLASGHLGGELRAAVPALAGLMVAHFVLSLLVTLAALAVGGDVLDAEIGARTEMVGSLVERFGLTLPLIVVASATEEIVFRGFMLPRLRVVVGSWGPALLLGAISFGLGHAYEGALATVQTAGVGLGLGVIYLWRRRLWTCIAVHVGFNALALLLALLALGLGLFDQAEELLRR